MKLSISYKMVLISVTGVVLSSLIILCIGSFMILNLFNRTINNEMLSVQSLISWINEQEEERLWQTLETLSSNPELARAVYKDDVKNVMEFAQISLRQINETSINTANIELINILIIIIICTVIVLILVAVVAGLTGRQITRSLQSCQEQINIDDTDQVIINNAKNAFP